MPGNSTLVRPAFHNEPPYLRTFGPEVADLATLAGFEPDPEQCLALDSMFAVNPAGRVSTLEFAVVAPRQNLKTGLFKQAALGWLYITDQRLVVWSAHEFRTAQEAFRDMTELIEGCPALSRRLKPNGISRGNGDEAIELTTGQRLIFKARTKGGGRGLSGDKVVLDEAYALQGVHMGSLLPTLSARPDPQVVYGSSAGQVDSYVLRAIRDRGRAGGDPSLSYIEWCDDLPGGCVSPSCDHALGSTGCVLDDVRRWGRANSQMGRRITVEYIAAERRALPPEEFGRERLGWWDEELGAAVIPSQVWDECEDVESQIVTRPCFALDVSPDRSWSAIAAAGTSGSGKTHAEITSRDDVIDYRPGTDWVLPRLIQLRDAFSNMKVTIAAGSAAESLKPDIERLGITVEALTARDVAAACGKFYDLAVTKELVHIGQESLTSALLSAKKRTEDGENAWIWGWKRSGKPISPLYAATLATWAAYQAAVADYDIADSIF